MTTDTPSASIIIIDAMERESYSTAYARLETAGSVTVDYAWAEDHESAVNAMTKLGARVDASDDDEMSLYVPRPVRVTFLNENNVEHFLSGDESDERQDEIRSMLIEAYEELGFDVTFRRGMSGSSSRDSSRDDSTVDDWNAAHDIVIEKMGL